MLGLVTARLGTGIPPKSSTPLNLSSPKLCNTINVPELPSSVASNVTLLPLLSTISPAGDNEYLVLFSLCLTYSSTVGAVSNIV